MKRGKTTSNSNIHIPLFFPYTNFIAHSYAGSDVIIVCYSVANFDSLSSIRNKWIHEIKEHASNRPIILGKIIN